MYISELTNVVLDSIAVEGLVAWEYCDVENPVLDCLQQGCGGSISVSFSFHPYQRYSWTAFHDGLQQGSTNRCVVRLADPLLISLRRTRSAPCVSLCHTYVRAKSEARRCCKCVASSASVQICSPSSASVPHHCHMGSRMVSLVYHCLRTCTASTPTFISGPYVVFDTSTRIFILNRNVSRYRLSSNFNLPTMVWLAHGTHTAI